jgi:hypothetical protein
MPSWRVGLFRCAVESNASTAALQIGGGPLNPSIKIDPSSIGSGKISQDKIGGNIELAAAVKVTDANIGDGSINASKLKDGNLDANVDVTNSNIGPATLRTDRYGWGQVTLVRAQAA